jgi:hypothetical protein
MKKNNILMFLVLCVLGLNRMDHMYDCGKGGTASAEGTWSISVADGISDPRIDSRNRTLPKRSDSPWYIFPDSTPRERGSPRM